MPTRINAFKKRSRVECAGRFIFVLEVHVHVALLGKLRKTLGEGIKLQRGIATSPAQSVTGAVRRSMNLGRKEIVTLGDAKRGVMLPEDRVDLVAEPRFVPKLECDRGALTCRNAGTARKLLRRSASALKLGGSWKRRRPSLPSCLTGSSAAMN